MIVGCPLDELPSQDFGEAEPMAVGTASFRSAVTQAALDSIRTGLAALERLPALSTPTSPAVQVALLLLRMCVLPRIILAR